MKPTVSLTSTCRLRRQHDVPHRRIERGEHFRVRQNARSGQPVEQRRFSGVGVAHQRQGRQRHRLPLLPLRGAAAAHALQAPLDGLNALVNPPPVGFEFGFAGTARADSAAQPRHRRAVAGQPGQQIIQLRQLDLQLAFAGSRAPGENVQDELGPVEDLHVQRFFQIALLRGRQLLVEDHHRRIVKVDLRLELVDFAGADQRRRIGARPRSGSTARRRSRPRWRPGPPVLRGILRALIGPERLAEGSRVDQPRPVRFRPTRSAISAGRQWRSSFPVPSPARPEPACVPASRRSNAAGVWNGRETTTVEIACLKISCSWLLVSSTTEYLSKLLILARKFHAAHQIDGKEGLIFARVV